MQLKTGIIAMNDPTLSLIALRDKLSQLKQLAGREMDYGSKSNALQNAYILATESLPILDSFMGGGLDPRSETAEVATVCQSSEPSARITLPPANSSEISVTELNQFWMDAQRDDLFEVIVPSDVRRLLAEISRLRQREPVSSEVSAKIDIVESYNSSEWIPPRLETIERWKQHEIISRRDWVGVLTILEQNMKPVSSGCIYCGHRFDGHFPTCKYSLQVAQQPPASVSVSLEKCAKAIDDVSKIDGFRNHVIYQPRKFAISVIDSLKAQGAQFNVKD